MSGKGNCKNNICKRKQYINREGGWKEDGFKGENYGWKEDGFKGENYGWKEDDFKGENYGWKEDDFKGENCGFKGENYGWKGENYGWKEDGYGKKCEEDRYAANRDNLNASRYNDYDRAKAYDQGYRSPIANDTDSHKLDKEYEDRHRRRNRQECKDIDNLCKRDHTRNNKKYLVDKLYIYEHHRVIDLDSCENDRDHQEAHKDFRDLESAADDFKEADVLVKNFSDENRKDLEAYEASRQKVSDLQAAKKNAHAAYVWSD
ncbi:hypothetical protein BH23THE1_BH23THE1_32120 [soil metagenome]